MEPYHLTDAEQSLILTICRSCRSRTRHTGQGGLSATPALGPFLWEIEEPE